MASRTLIRRTCSTNSRPIVSPVVTLLSPHPDASRRAQEIFGSVFGLQDCGDLSSLPRNDDLNAKCAFLHPSMSIPWDSVASQCPTSGTILHWVAPCSDTPRKGNFSLWSISTATRSNHHSHGDSIISQTRNVLSANLPFRLLRLRLSHLLRRPLPANVILARHQGLPLLDLAQVEPLSSKDTATTTAWSSHFKEVAFTMYDDAVYEDGSTVLDNLANLHRPVTGVYQLPAEGLLLRPLPAAKQDLRGPPVVFTFHCPDIQLQQQQQQQQHAGVMIQYAKIGFRGHYSQNGQLRLLATCSSSNDNLLPGLDVRWCDQTVTRSLFHEAQEALLASSLPELQSTNVLKGTGKLEKGADDDQIGVADCWMEVRTMARNPRGLASSNKPKIATAPPSYPD